MKRALPLSLAASALLATVIACGEEQARVRESVTRQAGTAEPRGDRLLGIDINADASGEFNRAFELGSEIGIDFVTLTVYWDDFETSPSAYAPEINWLAIANDYYSAAGIDLVLVVAPIDTNVLHTPEDLRPSNFDDPETIRRFRNFLDYALAELPDVDLVSISIGNEVDAYLGSDVASWEAYTTFFKAAVDYLHQLDPGFEVGVKTTFSAITAADRSQIQKLNEFSDVIQVTYYPLKSDFSVEPPEVVFRDFERLLEIYPNKPVLFLEIGYPSSAQLRSSEEAQAAFIRNAFSAWDQFDESIRALNFTWLHDVSPSALDRFSDYYGLQNANFRAYLATLGLREFDGSEKAAFEALQQEASDRGW